MQLDLPKITNQRLELSGPNPKVLEQRLQLTGPIPEA
jgi:hypothetical protein